MDGYSECTYCENYLTCMNLKMGKKCNKEKTKKCTPKNDFKNKEIKQSQNNTLNIDINLLELAEDGRLDVTMK